MLTISVTLVRSVSAAALLAFVLSAVLPLFDVIPFDDQVATARILSTYASVLPSSAIWAWSIVSGLTALVGLIGLLFLWPPSRWLLAAYAVALVVSQPLLGLAVLSPYEATFGGIFGTCLLWLVTVSFWSPFAGQFRKGPRPNAT
jgi:hypothetical protein